jgi:prephenate dehydrogenase
VTQQPDAPFGELAVLGLGLLGASVAAAALGRGAALRVVGHDRDPEQSRIALERGWVGAIYGAPKEAVSRAQLVVLATPVDAMAEVLAAAAPGLSPGCIVTDVGSVKACLARDLPTLLPPGVEYIGAHPMVGGHRGGAGFARENLFDGSAVAVTGDPSQARDRVTRFWRQLGAQIELRSPREHDLEVAWTSHVPHVLAFAFAGAFGDAPESAKSLIGAGFRDFTRIARSDPQMWAGILLANAEALARPLKQSAAMLEELATVLSSADGAKLEALLTRAAEKLRDTPES